MNKRNLSISTTWIVLGLGLLALTPTVFGDAGDLDPTFGENGRVIMDFAFGQDAAWSVAIQTDGKLVVAGWADSDPAPNITDYDFALARYELDGSLDPTFGIDGRVLTDFGSNTDMAYTLAIDKNGKIVVAGSTTTLTRTDFALARYTHNGSLDPSFGQNGLVVTDFNGSIDSAVGIAIDRRGRIVAVGIATNPAPTFNDVGLARYKSNGTLDHKFGNGGLITTDLASNFDTAQDVVIQPDGKILVLGRSIIDLEKWLADFSVIRYEEDGSLDKSFSGGWVTTDFMGRSDQSGRVALTPDGKIIAAGLAAELSEDWMSVLDYQIALAQYEKNGELDEEFGVGGKVMTSLTNETDESGYSIALKCNGKIIVTGYSGASVEERDFVVVSYLPNGQLDTSFGENGWVTTDMAAGRDESFGVAIQENGRIVAVGAANFLTADSDFVLARYQVGLRKRIERLIDRVDALAQEGPLHPTKARWLTRKLEKALTKLDNNQPKRAIFCLKVFTFKVAVAMRLKRLDRVHGKGLIADALETIEAIAGERPASSCNSPCSGLKKVGKRLKPFRR
jgi:uncharacterized delta-60 repeat protein